MTEWKKNKLNIYTFVLLCMTFIRSWFEKILEKVKSVYGLVMATPFIWHTSIEYMHTHFIYFVCVCVCEIYILQRFDILVYQLGQRAFYKNQVTKVY